MYKVSDLCYADKIFVLKQSSVKLNLLPSIPDGFNTFVLD